MKSILSSVLFLVLTYDIISCNSQKPNNSNYHTTGHNDNVFIGQLQKKDYDDFTNIIASELKVKIPINKSILINFYNDKNHCMITGFSQKKFLEIIENCFQISDKMCKEHNAIYFSIYSKLNRRNYLFKKNDKYIQDSGFFEELIFNQKYNCGGFFLLKPNGSFMKYYGEDYFSEVENFLIKKN